MTRLPANNHQEWTDLLASHTTGFIRTHEDWTQSLTDFPRVVQLFGDTASHPLAGLEHETIEMFTNSLMFRGGGLAHADYHILQDKLTELQFAQLWESFGISASLFLDCRDRACAGDTTHTCVSKPGSLCLPHC
jgi:hypothetical protein